MTENETRKRINPTKDGPLEVTGVEEIRGRQGKIQLENPAYLCRCGKSENKPFCDGSHNKAGFQSDKSDDRVGDKVRDYRGSKLTVHFNGGVCAHVGYCLRLSKVFNLDEKPWIQPDNEEAERVIEAVNKCPSGALSYSVEGVEFPDDRSDDTITMIPRGPYLVSGDIELDAAAPGEGAASKKYALCRCGASKNLPYCDGSHLRHPFAE